MKSLIITVFILFSLVGYSQTVDIYYSTPTYGNQTTTIRSSYEASYGVGNVNITSGPTLTDYSLYDIVIANSTGETYSTLDVTSFIAYVQAGGHLVLSTEGGVIAGGGQFMSSVWNGYTGQTITETASGASGTANPPRFHNSNGPWSSSPDPTLNACTGTYTSFANLEPINTIHQRNTTLPTCVNIEGISAVFPSRPNMGDGTLYIQGEVWYPFGAGGFVGSIKNHAEAMARMHYALLTNNVALLTQLNTWEANLVLDNDFIGNDTLICESAFVPFTKTSPVYASYSWEDLQGNVLATTATYMIPDTGTYLLHTVGVTPQCDGLDTLHVGYLPNPISSFTVNNVCDGEQAVFTNNSSIETPGTIQTTVWNFGDGNTSNASSASHLYANTGSYNVQLISTSSLGCMHDTTITVVVNSDPTAIFSLADVCLNINSLITESSIANSGTITNWNWNFGDVMPATTIQSTAQVPSYIYSQDGNYNITLIVVTDQGCDDTLVVNTVRYPIPEVSFVSIPACKNDSIIFTNTSSINAPDNITSWVWNYGNGDALATGLESNHQYLQDGFFNVTLIASSNNGCVSDVTNFIQVFPLPIAEFSSTTTCENGNSTSFFNFSTILQGSIANYSWDFDDNGATSSLQFANYSYSSVGTYNVELIVESTEGCKDTVWQDVEVSPKPEANFVADFTEGCMPYCTQFQDNSQSNATSITNYFWIFGNGEIRDSQDPEICFGNVSFVDDALYDVSLIVTNDLGCKDTVIENNYITVWPKPLAAFEADPIVTDMYSSTITFENLSEGGDTYSWYYDDGVQSSVFEEAHSYADTGTFYSQLIVSSINNCKDTADLTIQINPLVNVYIPSSFTPNGDGINDLFKVEGFAFDYAKFELLIFDRWGLLIYQTNNNTPWDGTYLGDASSDGVYIYHFEYMGAEGQYVEYEGHFNLLR